VLLRFHWIWLTRTVSRRTTTVVGEITAIVNQSRIASTSGINTATVATGKEIRIISAICCKKQVISEHYNFKAA